MSDEYQNGIPGIPDDTEKEAVTTDDFATTAEETVDDEPITEPVTEEPVKEEAPAIEGIENRTDYVQPPIQQNPVNNPYATQGYVNNQVPPYSQPYPNTQPTYYGYNQYNAPQTPAPQPPKKKKGLMVFLIILAFVIFIGIVFGAVSMVVRKAIEPNEDATSNTAVVQENDENAPVMQIEPSPSDSKVLTPAQVAEKVKPSVVAIIVYSNRTGGVVSEGSGILWKEDDSGKYTYIITCAHVITGSGQTYTVQTEDGTQYDAEMIGADAKTDLGVIRIEKTGLSLAEFGDSSVLRVGDPVYAIGNPGGTEFFGSFTDGVVSAIDRSVKSTYTMICIQHTAAINPGNSGGALVNAYGQVIGINSLKIIDTEYEGMGFAVPIKSAQPIINNLAAYGYVPNRPKLGISYTEAINYQQYSMIIKIKGLPSGSLIITEINADSALANTDAKQYDMIIGVNGQEMTSPDVLLDIIENGAVGDEITLTICRIDNNYQTTEFDVKVKLVEEKKVVEEETTVSSQPIDPFDYFNGFLW